MDVEQTETLRKGKEFLARARDTAFRIEKRTW
jgi:hypothetical protein